MSIVFIDNNFYFYTYILLEVIKINNNYPEYPYIGYKNENIKIPITFPKQHQLIQPGMEYEMNPLPIFDKPDYIPSCKLKDKVVIISGGDSGIGRAISVLFAKEGANLAISYLNEHQDANYTKQLVESLGRKCILFPGDLRDEDLSKYIAEKL